MEQLQTVAAGTVAGFEHRWQPEAHRKLLTGIQSPARRHRHSGCSQLRASCLLVCGGHHKAVRSADDPVADSGCFQQREAAAEHAGRLWRDEDHGVGILGGVQKRDQLLSARYLAATDAGRQTRLRRCRQPAVGEQRQLAAGQLKRIVGKSLKHQSPLGDEALWRGITGHGDCVGAVQAARAAPFVKQQTHLRGNSENTELIAGSVGHAVGRPGRLHHDPHLDVTYIAVAADRPLGVGNKLRPGRAGRAGHGHVDRHLPAVVGRLRGDGDVVNQPQVDNVDEQLGILDLFEHLANEIL